MHGLYKPTKCKFCKKDVIFHQGTGRIVEADGLTPHVDNCDRRKAHYKNERYIAAQSKRDQK